MPQIDLGSVVLGLIITLTLTGMISIIVSMILEPQDGVVIKNTNKKNIPSYEVMITEEYTDNFNDTN